MSPSRGSMRSSSDPTTFSVHTSTAIHRRHLFRDHLDEWVECCDKFGIEITAKDAQNAVSGYRRRKERTPLPEADDDKIPKYDYSPELLIELLVDWIISDDQVTSDFFHFVQVCH
jgi:hypothetical protein